MLQLGTPLGGRGEEGNPVLRDSFPYHCEIKHPILAFLLFILRQEETASCYIFMSTQFVLMDSLEHHILPRAHSHFYAQGPPSPPACLLVHWDYIQNDTASELSSTK